MPWSQGDTWGYTDAVRIDLAREFSRCLICGELVVEGQVLVIPKYLPEGHSGTHHLEDLQREPGWIVDHGPLHDHCVEIAVGHCPAVKRRLLRRELTWQPYMNSIALPAPPDHWTDGVTIQRRRWKS